MLRWETNNNLQLNPVVRLYNSVEWSGYTQKPLELLRGISNSSYVVSCWDAQKLVGLARVVSDDFSIMFLQDILVDPEYQRQGIGRKLITLCMEKYSHVRQKVLLTDNRPEQLAFYESLGFISVRNLQKTIINSFIRIEGADLS